MEPGGQCRAARFRPAHNGANRTTINYSPASPCHRPLSCSRGSSHFGDHCRNVSSVSLRNALEEGELGAESSSSVLDSLGARRPRVAFQDCIHAGAAAAPRPHQAAHKFAFQANSFCLKGDSWRWLCVCVCLLNVLLLLSLSWLLFVLELACNYVPRREAGQLGCVIVRRSGALV